VFKSTATQFMTVIYSMEYEPTNQQDEKRGSKLGLSWDQVGTKIGLSWDEVEKLFIALQKPKSMNELKDLYGWSNTTKFKVKFISPLVEEQFVGLMFPDKPTSPKQRYFLTDRGKALHANMTCDQNTNDLVEKVNHIIENLSEEEKCLVLDLLQKD
jgi:ATP-dependent DNA helicase RecG